MTCCWAAAERNTIKSPVVIGCIHALLLHVLLAVLTTATLLWLGGQDDLLSLRRLGHLLDLLDLLDLMLLLLMLLLLLSGLQGCLLLGMEALYCLGLQQLVLP